MEVKVAICDDEVEGCANLEEMLVKAFEATGRECETEIFYTGEAFCEKFEPKKYEIVFLDIEFSGMDGIEIGRFIRNKREDEYTQIVYISGKTQYAMELFQFHPLDFLEKPINLENIERLLGTYQKIEKQDDKIFQYCVKKSVYKIKLSEICYFESDKRKIRIHTPTENIEFYGKMDSVVKQVKNDRFIRIHQSYLVNYAYVKKIVRDSVEMLDGIILTISQNKYKEAMDQVMKIVEEESKKWD